MDVIGQMLAEAGADRRPGPRGPPPGLDHRPLARAVHDRRARRRPAIRGRRREAIGRGRRGGSWADSPPLRAPRGAGGWTQASRSGHRSPLPHAGSPRTRTTPGRVPERRSPRRTTRRLAGPARGALGIAGAMSGRTRGACARRPSGWGRLDLAVDFFTASIAALRHEGRLGLLARSLIDPGVTLRPPRDADDLASDLDEGFRLGVETRQPFFLATADVVQAIYLAFRGDIAGAEAQIGDVERVALEAPGRGRAGRDAACPRDHRPRCWPPRRGLPAAPSPLRPAITLLSRDDRRLGDFGLRRRRGR